jgi:hypothetical protein
MVYVKSVETLVLMVDYASRNIGGAPTFLRLTALVEFKASKKSDFFKK